MVKAAIAFFVIGIVACKADPAKVATTPAADTVYEVVGTDYTFKAPATIAPGRASFRFVNNGKVRHELSVARLKPGVSIDSLIGTVRADKTVRDLIEGTVGVIFAEPGESSYSLLNVDASAGSRYAIICIFRDSASAPAHADMGMYGLIEVSAGATPPAAVVATDTIVGTDYAFQYPRELTAGRHTIAFRNDGKMRHEIGLDLLKAGVTVAMVQAAEAKGENVDSLFDKSVGVLHTYGGTSPLGQLTFDVLPGREYMLICAFQNDAKSPEHYKLGMFGSIKGVASQTKS